MQTTPYQQADLQAACKKALTSTAFAKFMGTAVQTALIEAQNQPKGIVLALPVKRAACWSSTGQSFCIKDERWRDIGSFHKHSENSYWFGRLIRYDADCNAWERSFFRMVVDDFGMLVEVPSL